MISLDIVTPERAVISGVKVDSVSLPANGGEMQVLPGHADVMALLGTGALFFDQEGQHRRFVVSYGYAEITHDKVTILAETCEESHEIDVQRAVEAQRRAEEAMGSLLSREGFSKYERKVQRALERQQAAKSKQ